MNNELSWEQKKKTRELAMMCVWLLVIFFLGVKWAWMCGGGLAIIYATLFITKTPFYALSKDK